MGDMYKQGAMVDMCLSNKRSKLEQRFTGRKCTCNVKEREHDPRQCRAQVVSKNNWKVPLGGSYVHVVGPPVTDDMNSDIRDMHIKEIVKLALSIVESEVQAEDTVDDEYLKKNHSTIEHEQPLNIIGEKVVDAREDRTNESSNEMKKRFRVYAVQMVHDKGVNYCSKRWCVHFLPRTGYKDLQTDLAKTPYVPFQVCCLDGSINECDDKYVYVGEKRGWTNIRANGHKCTVCDGNEPAEERIGNVDVWSALRSYSCIFDHDLEEKNTKRWKEAQQESSVGGSNYATRIGRIATHAPARNHGHTAPFVDYAGSLACVELGNQYAGDSGVLALNVSVEAMVHDLLGNNEPRGWSGFPVIQMKEARHPLQYAQWARGGIVADIMQCLRVIAWLPLYTVSELKTGTGPRTQVLNGDKSVVLNCQGRSSVNDCKRGLFIRDEVSPVSVLDDKLDPDKRILVCGLIGLQKKRTRAALPHVFRDRDNEEAEGEHSMKNALVLVRWGGPVKKCTIHYIVAALGTEDITFDGYVDIPCNAYVVDVRIARLSEEPRAYDRLATAVLDEKQLPANVRSVLLTRLGDSGYAGSDGGHLQIMQPGRVYVSVMGPPGLETNKMSTVGKAHILETRVAQESKQVRSDYEREERKLWRILEHAKEQCAKKRQMPATLHAVQQQLAVVMKKRVEMAARVQDIAVQLKMETKSFVATLSTILKDVELEHIKCRPLSALIIDEGQFTGKVQVDCALVKLVRNGNITAETIIVMTGSRMNKARTRKLGSVMNQREMGYFMNHLQVILEKWRDIRDNVVQMGFNAHLICTPETPSTAATSERKRLRKAAGTAISSN